MNFNISTNILRDQTKDLKYIVTPNATKIFERIFNSENNSNKSFTIIGNYGTGKSTFLWALEKNLLKKNIFFSTRIKDKCDSYDFLKILGDATSLTFAFQKNLGLDNKASSRDIIDELEKRRKNAAKKKNGFVILIDEFGKGTTSFDGIGLFCAIIEAFVNPPPENNDSKVSRVFCSLAFVVKAA